MYLLYFSELDTPVPDSSTLENTTGDVMSPHPLSDDPVRGAIGVLSPTSPTTDTEHTTGDCTNKTNISIFCMNNNFSLTSNYSMYKNFITLFQKANVFAISCICKLIC